MRSFPETRNPPLTCERLGLSFAVSYCNILCKALQLKPEDVAASTSRIFLGVQIQCAQCHDHPFERWTQDQYYQTAAYFAQFELKPDPAGGKGKIGGTAVTGGLITVTASGSAANDVDVVYPTALNTVVIGDALEIETDGASTNTVKVTFTVVVRR